MKKITFNLLLAVFLIPTSIYSQDFRNVTWGMSPEEVTATEDLPSAEFRGYIDTSGFAYKTFLCNIPVVLNYYFEERKLTSAEYKIDTRLRDEDGSYIRYSEEAAYEVLMRNYNLFNELLTEVYGQPTESVIKWKDGAKKEYDGDVRQGMINDVVTMNAIWETENTKIYNSIYPYGSHKICYSMKNSKSLFRIIPSTDGL